MYFKRDIENDILKWYNSKNKKVLSIDGSRQVGKTATIKHFINEHYKNIITMDLERLKYDWFLDCIYSSTNNLAEIDVGRFTKAINKYVPFTNDKNTVIFIDEIQQDHMVYNQLRTLNRNLKCDVIVSGSYLSRALNPEFFQPAGDVQTLTLYTLSFCEFLRVVNRSLYGLVENWPQKEIEDADLDKIKKLFDYYMRIGGYPKVIQLLIAGSVNYADILEELESTIKLTIDSSRNKLELEDRTILRDTAEGLLMTMITNKRGTPNLYESIVKKIATKPNSRLSKDDCNRAMSWFRECKIVDMVGKYVLPDMVRDYAGEKEYFLDLGLLSLYTSYAELPVGNIRGLMAETFVHRAMLTNEYSKKFAGLRPHFGVYKDGEIDFFACCHADKLNYAFEVKYGNQPGKTATDLIKNHVADKIIYFMGDHRHKVDGNIEIVPLCLAERWFSEVKYPIFESFDTSLFDAAVFEY